MKDTVNFVREVLLFQNETLKKLENYICEDRKFADQTTQLAQNIKNMKRELAEMETRLEATKKWEPQTGKYYTATFNTPFQTKRHVNLALELMRKQDRIIHYVLEREPSWGFEFEPYTFNWTIGYSHGSRQWQSIASKCNEASTIYMPEYISRQLARDLNSGRVEL